MPKTIRNIARWKVYLDRGRAYMLYVQFIMIAVVFARSIASHPWFTWIQGHAIATTSALVFGLLGGCMVLGWVDTKTGLRDEEWKQLLRPVVDEIRKGS